MTIIPQSILLSLLLVMAGMNAPALAQTETSTDSAGNIQFMFDNVSSIKVAPRSSDPANKACATLDPASGKPVYEGAMRYNTNLNDIEYCDGVKWNGLTQYYQSAYAISVDYTQCTDAIQAPYDNSLYSYYGGSHNIHLACPKNYVIVASDASLKSNVDTYTDALCCKLTVK